ncbi:MAG: arginine--tRNA ligase, partial [Nitrososphaeraceae archaeon]|nr:arginine--tRNA ligase [Nitrososphaeraceae archaeon]
MSEIGIKYEQSTWAFIENLVRISCPPELYHDLIIQKPPSYEMGDLTIPCFNLSKIWNISPNKAAEEVVEMLQGSFDNRGTEVLKFESKGPYVNIRVDEEYLRNSIISEVLSLKGDLPHFLPNKKMVVIDYSSPNIAKDLAYHHLRSISIGGALKNIFKATGHTTVGINFLGDWGTQFGKIIHAFTSQKRGTDLDKVTIEDLNNLYKKTGKKTTKKVEKGGRVWLQKLEKRDIEALKIWEKFRDISVEKLSNIYEMLGANFDEISSESEYLSMVPGLIAEAQFRGVLRESDGALIIDLSAYDLPPCILQKEDGTSLYLT